jgi:hypothetical protein
MAFKFAYDLHGDKSEILKPFYIAKTTAVKAGQLVKFTPGTGIVLVAGDDFDDAFIGAAAEDHDGSTAGRQSGTEIKVAVSPSAVYSLQSKKELTATGGSTSTFVVAGLLPATDDLWNGGYIEVTACAASADLVGKLIPITDSTGATGTLTIPEQAAAFAAGDKARLHPGPLAIGSYGWDLTTDMDDVDYTSSGAEALTLVDVDPKNKLAFFRPRLHQFNGPAAI